MATEEGVTNYSEKIDGEKRNHHKTARFDLTDGFLGITQTDSDRVVDRVLLSPHQVKKLLAFVGR